MSTKHDEWFTPPHVIAAVKTAMGGIDLDPASNEIAQKTVGATTYYTREDDGLSKAWSGRVFVNPPYTKVPGYRNPQTAWLEKAAQSATTGDLDVCVALVQPSVSSRYWHTWVWPRATAVLFFRGRLAFGDGSKEGAPPAGANRSDSALVIYVDPDIHVDRAHWTRSLEKLGKLVWLRGR